MASITLGRSSGVVFALALALAAAACNPSVTWLGELHTSGSGGGSMGQLDDGDGTTDDATTTATDETGAMEGDDGAVIPLPQPPSAGCDAIDLLFVIDNSASMQTYQVVLAEEFPQFIETMHERLPPGINLHLGITTTDFDPGCYGLEATQHCQSTATREEILTHYNRPDEYDAGGNGTQGRLFEHAGRRFFSSWSSEDPTVIGTWFHDAALAAGTGGCSFEMPVAAAGFAAHPANAEANAGFLRDEGALLAIFFLTDEPDKSVESDETYRDMILQAKAGCGEECVLVSGLVPPCILDVNQKLWQFMKHFSHDDPLWGDIDRTYESSVVFSEAFAEVVASACSRIESEPHP